MAIRPANFNPGLVGFQCCCKRLMGTLTLGLSVAIGAAIAAISKYRDAQKKAREEAEKARKAQSEFNKFCRAKRI